MPSMIRNIVRNLFHRPATRKYPFEQREPIAGSRGHLKNDIDACIFCGLCVRRCPSAALAVTKNPKSWTFDPYRCVVCGACVEVCPKKCLSMDPQPGKYD